MADIVNFRQRKNSLVLSTQNNCSSSSTSSFHDNVWEIHEKMQCAFSNVNTSFPLTEKETIIQFWAPNSGRRQLSTSEQPFSLDPRLGKYRLCSIKYQYSIIIHVDDDVNNINNNNNKLDDNGDNEVVVEVKNEPHSTRLINGPVATAFLNHTPQVVKDLRVCKGKGNPLVDSALDCGLTSSMMLPVFSQSSRSCVGVVECSMKLSDGLHRVLFKELKTALERVGLSVYHVKEESRPHKVRRGLKPPNKEIMCLPNLKFNPGKQNGDELRVLQTPKALREETNRSLAVKRKFSDLIWETVWNFFQN